MMDFKASAAADSKVGMTRAGCRRMRSRRVVSYSPTCARSTLMLALLFTMEMSAGNVLLLLLPLLILSLSSVALAL